MVSAASYSAVAASIAFVIALFLAVTSAEIAAALFAISSSILPSSTLSAEILAVSSAETAEILAATSVSRSASTA